MTIEFNLESPKSISVQAPSDVTTVVAQQPTQTVTVSGLVAGTAGPAGADGQGLIVGGTENEFLQKNSATDYDTKWSAYTLPGADGDDGQVLTTDGAGTVSFAFPQTIAEDVKNVSGGTLSKGTPVHVTGSVGNLAEVIAADAATNYPAHFVLNEDIADEGEGLGIALGFINNVDVPDASIYTEGQTVYLGASGGWTTTKPTGTNAIQNLGIIIKVNVTGGGPAGKISGIIMGAGRANDVPNIPNGQAWIGNASGVATPTTLATVATTGSYSDISGTPSLATVATTGAYSDLSGTPTIPSGDLVDDTTPQLGGDLDVNGNDITAASGNITMSTGSSNVVDITTNALQLKGTLGGRIRFFEASSGSNFITLQPPVSLASSPVFVLPSTIGLSGQVLGNSGSGVMTWVDPGVDVSGTPSDNQLAVWTDADTIEGDSNLTWDGSELAVTGQKLYPSTTGSNQFYGDIVDFGSGPAGVDGDIALGNIYYLSSTNQQWELADADAVATSSGMLGLAIADDSTKMLVKGFARATAFAGLTTGAPLYLSATAGNVTVTAPNASGDVVRVVGYCTDSGSREIYFDPSKDWIELS